MAWSMHVTTDGQQRLNKLEYQSEDETLFLLSHSFKYSRMNQFWEGHGHCLSVILVMTLTTSEALQMHLFKMMQLSFVTSDIPWGHSIQIFSSRSPYRKAVSTQTILAKYPNCSTISKRTQKVMSLTTGGKFSEKSIPST